ncbi:arrestin domain-containing protein 3-like [Dendronephthya gigantea]|uniref:arrestin domain-containing protein 3-like n=1 Tax=Dendronephthya gigantea TaxID=151771 RepID=UPI00106B3A0A|nr:arrestin domain-containing protein 3-like [Dendronephthya gigantea]
MSVNLNVQENKTTLRNKGLEHFHIAINDRQVFHPGETLTGVVQLFTTKVLYARRLFVKISGQAYVKWTESCQVLDTTEFVNCENYLNDNRVLFESAVNNDFETLLPCNHQFPFSFIIQPSHLPSSFYHGWHKKDYAAIRYWITATIILSNDEELTETQVFYLKETADLTEALHLHEPKAVSTEQYVNWCCFKTGPVRINLEINRSAYHPGDDILITAGINSAQSSFNTGKVEVQLIQMVKYIANHDYTGLGSSRKTNQESLERQHWSTEKNLLLSASVVSRRQINWDNVRLRIPKAIVPTISCSKCVQLSYFVQLRISFRGREPDCILRIPIMIMCKPRPETPEETPHSDSRDEN